MTDRPAATLAPGGSNEISAVTALASAYSLDDWVGWMAGPHGRLCGGMSIGVPQI